MVLGKLSAFSWAAILIVMLLASPLSAQSPKAPRVFLINAKRLAETKQRIQSGDKTFDAALGTLDSDARKALRQEPVSVTTKGVTPPSGDKHDYMSQAPYISEGTNVSDLAYYFGRKRNENDFHGIGAFLIMNEQLGAASLNYKPKPLSWKANSFGVRRQSEASTALWTARIPQGS